MNPDETPATAMAEMGALLYGPTWQSDVARLLGVNARLVRRWVAGSYRDKKGRLKPAPVPPARLAQLREALEERREAISAYLASRPAPASSGL